MTITEIYSRYKQCSGVCIDSRKVKNGQLFFGLRGENTDGNLYAVQALQKGASFAVIDNPKYKAGEKTILVENAETTLQKLAKYHREQLDIPVLGLTGSNGKTTTKELIHRVLSKKYNTLATQGNLNNHLGVPLTILSIKPSHDFAVIEMGANHQGEIAYLCEIAKPDFGLITNYGKAHLEGFGGVAGVIKGKSEMYTAVHSRKGLLFVNADDPLQMEKAALAKKFTFSQNASTLADLHICLLASEPKLVLTFKNREVICNIYGAYNFTNIAYAMAVGTYFGVTDEHIAEAVSSYESENSRSQVIEQNTNRIFMDAYNANPSSMMAALTHFDKRQVSEKVLILGDMFELGKTAAEEHQKLVDYISEMQITQAFLAGNHFKNTIFSNPKIQAFDSTESLINHLKDITFSDKEILIKGSRGMALENILSLL
ncbi:MAG: UDP-N-acetylmuramoyl-tripeptide--D-alanyl-D-alanine ligase [Flavobacteriaceae bacterium]|nr:UDP-N-acetylmuramoyl-tripeptide--D-alanyl-D-alanine ligase [Flavobacteriaceae bacterium]